MVQRLYGRFLRVYMQSKRKGKEAQTQNWKGNWTAGMPAAGTIVSCRAPCVQGVAVTNSSAGAARPWSSFTSSVKSCTGSVCWNE